MLCWQAELQSALIELGEVEHAMEDVMGLLQQVESDLQQFGDVYGDPRHIEVHLRKIQASLHSVEFCPFWFSLNRTACCRYLFKDRAHLQL